MKTGPALRRLVSHRSIHDGAYAEARDLTKIVEKLLQEKRMEDCLKTVHVLIDYWETRMIAHADSEEEGLYLEILAENPQLEKEIHMLTRDHDLIRIIVKKVKGRITKDNIVTKGDLEQFYALLIINEIHSRSEELMLLGE